MTGEHGRAAAGSGGAAHPSVSSTADTVDLRLPDGAGDGGEDGAGDGRAAAAHGFLRGSTGGPPGAENAPGPAAGRELLGDIAAWGPAAVRAGTFRLLPARADRDLPLVSRWLRDSAAVLRDGPDPVEAAGRRLRLRHGGDGRLVPCLGLLDGVPMSYWEIYRADLAPLARHFPTRPHDTGVRLLIGAPADRGRGLGSALLRAVSGLVLDNRPSCTRVVGEPDLCDTPSVAAFLRADFRFSAEVDLPGGRAAVLIRDRSPHGPR
ncbi:GNAT family N-acetyltransferase [Streptomyces albus]|uniref:GNAT family N-acetyltransferase n=1 Tax=Streptomyces albus TaxID=1888 RepID=UPI0004C798BA|nr:GNAT family N-acetyltransferase [Streptomyces albus]